MHISVTYLFQFFCLLTIDETCPRQRFTRTVQDVSVHSSLYTVYFFHSRKRVTFIIASCPFSMDIKSIGRQRYSRGFKFSQKTFTLLFTIFSTLTVSKETNNPANFFGSSSVYANPVYGDTFGWIMILSFDTIASVFQVKICYLTAHF